MTHTLPPPTIGQQGGEASSASNNKTQTDLDLLATAAANKSEAEFLVKFLASSLLSSTEALSKSTVDVCTIHERPYLEPSVTAAAQHDHLRCISAAGGHLRHGADECWAFISRERAAGRHFTGRCARDQIARNG